MKIIRDLWPKARDLVSDGFDESLEYISTLLPLKIFEIPSGTQCWTWIVPKKWKAVAGWIKDVKGNIIIDFKDNPLHIISYSQPINKEVTKDELMEHLFSEPKCPNAVRYSYAFYKKNWGFGIEHNKIKKLDGEKFQIFIDSKFEDGLLKVGEHTIKGETDDVIVLVAHLDHPFMANDDLTGVAALIEIANELKGKKLHFTYKFLFVSETIGSIAFLSKNEELIKQMKYGLFLEMLGNENSLALQFSRQGNTRIDRIAKFVIKKKTQNHREGAFRKIVANDEMVFNGPGVNVPMISISRYPYNEYHTSADSPDIIKEEKLQESKDIILEILNIIDKDYVPERQFKGPIFLTGMGLWVDWRKNLALNQSMEDIMLNLEGDKSIFDIAEELDLEFKDVLEIVEKYYEKSLIKKKIC